MATTTPTPEFVDELIELLLVGRYLRPERVAEVRRWLEAGVHPDPREVAEAVVREAASVHS